MPSETQNFEREKLYEEIWSEPLSKVAKRYQISDVGLRKICVNLSIPIPSVGYWAKIAAGQTVKKPSLAPTKGATTCQRTIYNDPQDDERSMHTRVGLVRMPRRPRSTGCHPSYLYRPLLTAHQAHGEKA